MAMVLRCVRLSSTTTIFAAMSSTLLFRPNRLHDFVGDFLQRSHEFGGASTNRLAGHAENERCRFVLNDRAAACFAYAFQTLRAVAAHSREQDAEDVGAIHRRGGLHEPVDRRPVSPDGSLAGQRQALSRRDLQMAIVGREVNLSA